MRRRLLLLLLLPALVAAAPAWAGEAPPTPADIEDEVLCPSCETTLDQSNAPVALRMKAFIRERIAAGDTKSEIKAQLVADFGESVLAAPPRRGFNLLAWWLPIGGVAAGAVALGLLAWRWSRARSTDVEGPGPSTGVDGPPPALDPELEQRVDEELARFEA